MVRERPSAESGTNKSYLSWGASLRFDAVGVDELRPVGDLVDELRLQHRRRRIGRLDVDLGEAVAQLRRGERLGERGAQLALNGLGHSGRAEQAPPESEVDIGWGDAALAQRRQLRKHRRALRRGDGQALD